MHNIWNVIWGFFVIAFTFGVAIFVHEFGHFITGKLAGVPVKTFSIGFGKKIWKKEWKGTTYAIGIIPFGGYVQFKPLSEAKEERLEKKEEEEEKDGVTEGAFDDMDALRVKPYPIRLLVYSAGVLMNYLTAVFVLIVMLTVGFKLNAPYDAKVGLVLPPLTSFDQPLSVGDTLLKVEGKAVNNWEDFVIQTAQIYALNKKTDIDESDKQKAVNLTVERKGVLFEKEFPLYIGDIGSTPSLAFLLPHVPAYIEDVFPNGPAEKAGVKAGDYIRAINSKPINTFYDLRNTTAKSEGRELNITLERLDNETNTTTTLTVQVTPSKDIYAGNKWSLGVFTGNPKKITFQFPFPVSILEGFNFSFGMIKTIVEMTGEIFASRNINLIKKNVGGPVAIGVMVVKSAKKGASDYFSLFVTFNLLLFIINILPIPILDGGHVLIATMEALIGRPIPKQVLAPVFYLFFILLITLMVFVVYNDIQSNAWRVVEWLTGAER